MHTRRLLPALLTGLMAASAIHAQETEWTNPGTGDFANAANWSAGLPGPQWPRIRNGGTAELASVFAPSLPNLAVESGSTLRITGAGALAITSVDPRLTVGINSSLVVSNGGTLTNSTGEDSIFNGSSALVTGANSRWNGFRLSVGSFYSAASSLIVSDHGAVTNTTLWVGNYDGTGTVTVTDHGTLQASQIFVGEDVAGKQGTGTLTVETGGRISATTITVASQAGGTGTLNLDVGGTLALGGVDSIVAGEGTAHINFNGGTLEVTGSALTSSADINLAATSTFDTHNLGATLSGSLSGTGGLIKAGAGTLTLSGGSSYSGTTTVQLGTLALTGATARLDNTSGLVVGGDSSATVSVTGGATLTSTGAITLGNANNDYEVAGTLEVSGPSSSLAAAALSVGDTSTGIFTVSEGARATINGDLKFGTQNSVTFFPEFSNLQGNGVGTITGTGSRLEVTGNLYSGYYSFGTLSIEAGAEAVVGGSVSVSDQRGTGELNTTGALTVTGTGSRLDVGVDLIVGNFMNGTFSVESGGQVDVAGAVVVAGGSGGRGTLNLAAGGTLVVGGADGLAIGSGLGTINFAGGSLRVGASDLTSSAPIALATGSSSTIDTDGRAAAFSGVLSDSGGLVKTGAGMLTLDAANTYTGATTISAGTLALGAGGSLASSSIHVAGGATFDTAAAGGFTLASGRTLTGSGTVDGLFAADSGAHLAPGNSPGTLTFAGGLTLLSGAVLDFELGTASDLIAVTGGVLTGPSSGTVTINLFDTGGFAANTYEIFDFSGATLSDFTASDFDLGTTIAGYDYSFVLTGSSLNLVATASAIPEPSTCAVLAGLAALGLVMARRHRVRTAG